MVLATTIHQTRCTNLSIQKRMWMEISRLRIYPAKRISRSKPFSTKKFLRYLQLWKRLRRDSKLAGYHLLVTVSDTADFELQQRLETSINAAISDLEQGSNTSGNPMGWMQMSVETAQLNRTINRKLAKFKKWDAPAGSALICVYNARGKQLERKLIASTSPDFADSIKTLMSNNAPTKPDAVNKWTTAFETASEDSRRVFVVFSDPHQESGRHLRRWVDEAEETLQKDFVLLNIDTSFDSRLDEALVTVEDFQLESPSIAILDADQRVVSHIGKFPARRARRQVALQQVLEQGCQKIKRDEIKRIVSQSAALGGG